MILSVRSRAAELEVITHEIFIFSQNFHHQFSFVIALNFQVPFLHELIDELKFIIKFSGNTKEVKRKQDIDAASLGRESRSMSRSTCSQTRELTRTNIYECRPSLKNLEKLDLMPESELSLRRGSGKDGEDV